jgi:hypothetical protein
MKKENSKKQEIDNDVSENECPHLYMKAGKNAGEKLCISCGQTIYISRLILAGSSVEKES